MADFQPPPNRWEAASRSPWSYRPKSQERFEEDQRAAHVLARLAEQDRPLPPEIAKQVAAYERSPEQWTSSYESTAGSHPIYNAAMWAQSMPSAIYATGKMLGNEIHRATAENEDVASRIPYPEAYDQYQHSANTLTGGALDSTGPSYWKDVEGVRLQQERTPRIGLLPGSVLDERVAKQGHDAAQQIEEGRHFLERSGAHPAYAAIAGPLLDATLSFPSSLGPAAQSLKAGKPLAALLDMGGDVLLSNPQIPAWGIKKYSEGKLPWEE